MALAASSRRGMQRGEYKLPNAKGPYHPKTEGSVADLRFPLCNNIRVPDLTVQSAAGPLHSLPVRSASPFTAMQMCGCVLGAHAVLPRGVNSLLFVKVLSIG